MTGARVTVAVVAVLMVAWLVVVERDWRLQKRAFAESGTPPATNAYKDFRRARFLNPDTTPDVLLGLLESVHGKRALGISRLEDVLRREPENLSAWSGLFTTARGHDDRLARRALTMMRRLDPLDFQAPRG